MNKEIIAVREEAAEKEHEQWLRWAGTVIKDLYEISSGHSVDCICPSCKRIRRWKPNMIPYCELSEEMKEYDRIEADRILKIKGLAVSSADQKLPQSLRRIGYNFREPDGYSDAQEDMLKANFRRIITE